MIQNLYAIYDHAAKAFLPPFILRNDGQALRAFSDCVNSESHQFNQHPGDYNLFRVGSYDDSIGQMTNESPSPHNLGGGFQFLKPKISANGEMPFPQLQPVNGALAEDIQ